MALASQAEAGAFAFCPMEPPLRIKIVLMPGPLGIQVVGGGGRAASRTPTRGGWVGW